MTSYGESLSDTVQDDKSEGTQGSLGGNTTHDSLSGSNQRTRGGNATQESLGGTLQGDPSDGAQTSQSVGNQSTMGTGFGDASPPTEATPQSTRTSNQSAVSNDPNAADQQGETKLTSEQEREFSRIHAADGTNAANEYRARMMEQIRANNRPNRG